MEASPEAALTTSPEVLRLRLLLGKFRVLEVFTPTIGGKTIKVDLGGSTTMSIHIPYERAEVRPGDLLTYYTEVPIATPDPTPK